MADGNDLSSLASQYAGNTTPSDKTRTSTPIQNPPAPIPTQNTKPTTSDPIDSIMNAGLSDAETTKAIRIQHAKDQDEANHILYNQNSDGTPKPELHDYISRTLENVKYLRNKVADTAK